MNRTNSFLRIVCLPLIIVLLVACAPSTRAEEREALPKATRTDEGASQVMPVATPSLQIEEGLTPTPTCSASKGEVTAIAYPGKAINGEIPVRIYTPPCYGDSQGPYPVIYLLHGYPFDENQWEDLGVVSHVDEGIIEGDWPPFLLVMPLVPEPLFTRSDGGPGSYETEMLDSLMPYIEEEYEVKEGANSRGIAGISRGGVWALEIAFRNPTRVNHVASLSPSLSVNNARPAYDPIILASTSDQLPERIMVTAGLGEPGFLVGIERLVTALQGAGVDHYYLLTNGAHNEAAWVEVIDDVISYLAEGFIEEDASNYVK